MFLSRLLKIQDILFLLMRFWSDVGSCWGSAVDPCCNTPKPLQCPGRCQSS